MKNTTKTTAIIGGTVLIISTIFITGCKIENG